MNGTIGCLMLNDSGRCGIHPFAMEKDTNQSCNTPGHQSFLPCWIPKKVDEKRGDRFGLRGGPFLWIQVWMQTLTCKCINKPRSWLFQSGEWMRPNSCQMMALACFQHNRQAHIKRNMVTAPWFPCTNYYSKTWHVFWMRRYFLNALAHSTFK